MLLVCHNLLYLHNVTLLFYAVLLAKHLIFDVLILESLFNSRNKFHSHFKSIFTSFVKKLLETGG